MNNQIPMGYIPNPNMNASCQCQPEMRMLNRHIEDLERRVRYLEYLNNPSNYNTSNNKTIDNGYPQQNENYML